MPTTLKTPPPSAAQTMTTATRTSGAWEDAFNCSIQDPEAFWGEAGDAIHWYKRWDKVLDDSRAPFYRWFTGGQLNTCFNALDRHVETGRADQTALIYDSPVTNQRKAFTYRELRDTVAQFAGALAQLGVGKGDRVVIYMPMIPEVAVAMLGCARLGAVHSVVFGGFASRELAVRIDDARPKVIGSASCGIEGKRILPYKPLLDEALASPTTSPKRRSSFNAPWSMPSLSLDAISTGMKRWPRPIPTTVFQWQQPIRSTSSIPPAPPANPRAWSAITVATRSR
jgi:propionyl-CoA synthetase